MPAARAGLLLAVLALAGCGGSRAAGEPAPPRPPDRSAQAQALLEAAFEPRPRARARVAEGFRVRRVGEARLSLALPRGWMSVTRLDAVHPGASQTLARAYPRLAPFLAGLLLPESPLVLLGFERGGTDATISVLVSPVRGGMAYADWARAVERQVRALPTFRAPLRARRVALAAGDAVRLSYLRRTGGRTLATLHYVVVRGERAYAIVYAVPARDAARYRALFDASARTLSLDG